MDVIDADTLTEPLVFCVITGSSGGWFICDVRTSARTLEEAHKIAEEFIKGIFPGRHKLIREEANANEQRDFEHDCRVVYGHSRFAFRLEDGPTEHSQDAFGAVRYVGFGQ
jgi:hypothetical protein